MNCFKKEHLLILLVLCAFSCKQQASFPPVNATPDGVAIKGYDPVAYFTYARPVMGSAAFEYSWSGARWRFSSQAHRDLFMSAPDKFAPRYGGYCAYAVSQGKFADIDPEAWTIFEDRLYLNLNKDVRKLWEKDIKQYIQLSEKNWPAMTRSQH